MKNEIIHADALRFLTNVEDGTFDFIYVDPPFNTGRTQTSARTNISFEDDHADYIEWTRMWVLAAHRVLKSGGTICVHMGEKNAHKVRCLALDPIFGEENWLSTIIWHWDFGGRAKDRWPQKHDQIMIYAKNIETHVFNYDLIDRVPYMTKPTKKSDSRFVTEEKAKRGKTLTDVWWRSIVGTNSKERVGYPTQKPVEIVERLIRMHSRNDAWVLDFFAGSGTTGVAAYGLGRTFTMVDSNSQAIETMRSRFSRLDIPYVEHDAEIIE